MMGRFKLLLVTSLVIITSDREVVAQGECTDIRGRQVSHGLHYVPGPDTCSLCICDNGLPKVCKAVLCSPPQDCRSFRVGSTCCEFICLDDVVKPINGDAYETQFRLTVGCSATLALVTIAVIAYKIHKVKRRSRPNNDERSSTSIGYISGSMGYMGASCETALAAWKPPGHYLPRGEAPPPYEEVMAQCRQDLNRIHTDPSFHRSYPTSVDTYVRAEDPMHCSGHYVNVPRPILQIANPQSCYNAPLLQQIHPSQDPHRDLNQLPHHPLLPPGNGLCGTRLTGSLGAICGRAVLQAARDVDNHHLNNCPAPLHRTIPRMSAIEVTRRSFHRVPTNRRPHASLRNLALVNCDTSSMHLLSTSPAPAPRVQPAATNDDRNDNTSSNNAPTLSIAPDNVAKSSPRTPAKMSTNTSEAAPSTTLPLTVDKPSCVCSYSSSGNSGNAEETDDYRSECENCKSAATSKWAVEGGAGGAGGAGGWAQGSQSLQRRAAAAPPPPAAATLPAPLPKPRNVLGQPSNWENWFNTIPDSDTESEEE